MSVLVNKQAPDFTAPTVMPNNEIREDWSFLKETEGKYRVLFFYPLDFTFVCPSEIIAFDNRVKEFEKRNCAVVACSIDSHFTHLAWKNTSVNDGGIGQVNFPMVADLTKSIARDYDVLVDESVALRGTFLIDRDGVVQHQVVNNLPLGRNIDEAIRMLDALQFHEENGEVCPAGWQEGSTGMKDTPEGVASYLSENAEQL
ncbi:peroxiredoxin [Thiohalorhabdus methylotrophus]|uniref:Thioredoxin peroxidase n=1 Tax=Thiohalorhabdus methylotrophus TaxID=3242694 RepID=A0ABV4TUY8_9GAMM